MCADTAALARRLTSLGYSALFRAPDHEVSLENAWNSASQEDFEKLVSDENATPLARFLSSQILLSKDMSFLSRTNLRSLSEVYVEALLGNYSQAMSDWGFLHRNYEAGILGTLFLVFGEAALPALMNLLSNDTVVDYERPAPDISGFDPTMPQRVRIKDFAALYLSQIKNWPLELKATFSERDEEIQKLSKRLLSE